MGAEKPASGWVASWGASPVSSRPIEAADVTYRDVVHLSLGGNAIRIKLTNELGEAPITVGTAHVALSAGNGQTQPGTDHALTFNGRTQVMIPAGAMVVSDPIPMPVAALSDLAVSVYLPQQPVPQAHTTCHDLGSSTSYIATGDATAATAVEGAKTLTSWCVVKGVDVQAADQNAFAVATLGDSITDGAASTPDANHRWPDFFAQRLQADKKTKHIGVLNEGISGNRLLYDGAGPSALARLDRDVLAQSGVKYLVVLEAINDIGRLAHPGDLESTLTAADVEFAYKQIIERAHQHGIKVYGATLTPYVGAGYATPAGEAIREAVNQWIRTPGNFDGFIDFDKATQDPQNPTKFLLANEHGDHLHPNDTGYKVMSDSIDLKLFQ
ncbi:SGNH/GDSL hydrolase family protein [Silvibacterium sp.]|uniref:SGNH/GDSL hydrolase family protein n=1 Tax=Silvibacterium sp. TaxID=1964179 RepID=UPI0039E4D51C